MPMQWPLLWMMLAQEWQPLFDGRTLAGWRETAFPQHGAVRVADGAIRLEPGQPMTGITRSPDAPALPKSGYELRYEARRERGNDFFAAVTFPVGDSFLTFINGGWGGDIIGLSSLDNANASENETRAYFNFENQRWYRFRIEVRAERVRVWIDGERVVDVSIAGRELGLRPGDTKLMAPFGFASFATQGALRGIEYRLVQ